MAAYGVPEDHIAKVLRTNGIAPKTLRKYFRRELDRAHIVATAQVAGFLFDAAKKGNVSAMIFWMKTRGGWREQPQEHNHRGTVGTYDLTKASDSELQRLEEILSRISIANSGASGAGSPEDGGGAAPDRPEH